MTEQRKRLAAAIHEAILGVCAEHEITLKPYPSYISVSLFTTDERWTEGGCDFYDQKTGQLDFRVTDEPFRNSHGREIRLSIFSYYQRPEDHDETPRETATGNDPF